MLVTENLEMGVLSGTLGEHGFCLKSVIFYDFHDYIYVIPALCLNYFIIKTSIVCRSSHKFRFCCLIISCFFFLTVQASLPQLNMYCAKVVRTLILECIWTKLGLLFPMFCWNSKFVNGLGGHVEGVWEQGAKEYVWTEEGSNRRLEKTV
jgi:hypothetical protein